LDGKVAASGKMHENVGRKMQQGSNFGGVYKLL
jgi:hypothetical protein